MSVLYSAANGKTKSLINNISDINVMISINEYLLREYWKILVTWLKLRDPKRYFFLGKTGTTNKQ